MKYVAYYRVSTREQETSHLGLDAQRDTVMNYIRNNGNEIIAEFTEVESGRRNDRPQLSEAIRVTKLHDATLVIAKLDRLSRNMKFITDLMESKVKFVCCDMPDATELTIHIFAALAQWERKRISERTKEGLDAKRRRDPNWKPGTPNLTDADRQKGQEAVRRKAREDTSVVHAWDFIRQRRENGMSYQQIADELNAKKYLTRTGKKFHKMQVYNICKRFEKGGEV